MHSKKSPERLEEQRTDTEGLRRETRGSCVKVTGRDLKTLRLKELLN